MEKISKTTISIFLGLILTGCMATAPKPLNPDQGRAVREAMNKQIVDPNPKAGAPIMNPEKRDAAIERYLTDQVKKPKEVLAIDIESDG